MANSLQFLHSENIVYESYLITTLSKYCYHGLPLRFVRPNIPYYFRWWRHQMEIFSALLAICAGNSPVTGEFPTQRPVTRSFDVYFDLRPKERLSKQWWGWWFETLSRSLWRHRNGNWVSAKGYGIFPCFLLPILDKFAFNNEAMLAMYGIHVNVFVHLWYPENACLE